MKGCSFIHLFHSFPGDLVELLWILVQKNKTVVSLAHIPVYLAAYNATLSAADQYILFVRILTINRSESMYFFVSILIYGFILDLAVL